MFLKQRMLFIYVETALHAGAGSGLGAVDLPIQRERATDYPLVQASGLKGALRSAAAEDAAAEDAAAKAAAEVAVVFGPEVRGGASPDHAGAVSFGDARILLFPVRSLKGVFAWVTSKDVLERFRRDAIAAGVPGVPGAIPPAPDCDRAWRSGDGAVLEDHTAVLEEYAFTTDEHAAVVAWAGWLSGQALPQVKLNDADVYEHWQQKLLTNLLVLPEDAFRDFARHSTEVVTRVRLDPNTKTVATGALWTEERLPADTLLYAPVHATKLRAAQPVAALSRPTGAEEARAVLDWVADEKHIPHATQIGGDETVGRGMVRLRWSAMA